MCYNIYKKKIYLCFLLKGFSGIWVNYRKNNKTYHKRDFCKPMILKNLKYCLDFLYIFNQLFNQKCDSCELYQIFAPNYFTSQRNHLFIIFKAQNTHHQFVVRGLKNTRIVPNNSGSCFIIIRISNILLLIRKYFKLIPKQVYTRIHSNGRVKRVQVPQVSTRGMRG